MQILMVVTREIAQKRAKNAKLTLQDTVSQEKSNKKSSSTSTYGDKIAVTSSNK